jgi:hypothetical protein
LCGYSPLTRTEPVGIARSKDALEANDWAGNDDDDLDLDELEDGDEDDAGLSLEATELEMEMFGMKQAIYGGGDYDTDEDEKVGKDGGLENDEKDKGKDDEEEGVEQLEAMMLKMQAMRGMSLVNLREMCANNFRYGFGFAGSGEEEVCRKGCEGYYEDIMTRCIWSIEYPLICSLCAMPYLITIFLTTPHLISPL